MTTLGGGGVADDGGGGEEEVRVKKSEEHPHLAHHLKGLAGDDNCSNLVLALVTRTHDLTVGLYKLSSVNP